MKRLTGQRFDDTCALSETKSDKDPIISVWYNGDEKAYTAKRISDMVVDKLWQMARDDHIPVTDGVVTIPANVNDHHTNVLKMCGRMLMHMNEPTIAAIAYCFAEKASLVDGMNILIFGLGGGTVNAALLAMEDGILKVKSTDGDTLGVNDFVDMMVDHVANEFEENNKEFCGCPIAFRGMVWARCEEAVKVLSYAHVTTIEYLSEGINFRCSITRDKFEELNVDLFRNCLVPVEKCLKQAGMEGSCVQGVVLVGSATKIPRLQYLLQNMFRGKQLVTLVNPDESFARSATVLRIPMFSVTPHSLCLQMATGMAVMIPKNTLIPISMHQHFATICDNQSSVIAHVCQPEVGGSAHPLIGDLILRRVTPAPKGVTKIKVCFAVDNGGILEVSADDVTNPKGFCNIRTQVKVERLVARSSDA